MINHRLIFFSIIVLTFTIARSQDCGCDVTFSKDNDNGGLNILNGESAPYNTIPAGGTLCVQAGDYQGIRFTNFTGAEGNPITIKNCGGLVTVHDGILVLGSQYIKLSGAGHEGTQYGFTVLESNGTGVELKELTSDIEVEFVEIGHVGFAGIMAKTDPQCDQPETWRENFTFKNLLVHDNYIHDTEGEGIYIGYTAGNKTCNGSTAPGGLVAHYFTNVQIYNNYIEDTGWDGLQLNLAYEDVAVYNNTVYGYGIEHASAQNFGWSIGGGTRGRFYSNVIIQKDEYKVVSDNDSDLTSSGAQIISTNDTYFYNNIIVNSERHGLFIHQRTAREDLDFEEGYYFINNTIIGAGLSCILLNTQTQSSSDEKNDWKRRFHNNLLVAPEIEYENINFWKDLNENYIDYNTLSMRDASADFISNNLYVKDIADVGFVNPLDPNPDAEDFKILETSDAVNAGIDVSSDFGVSTDFGGFSRPVGSNFDIGAWEFGASNIAPIAETIESFEVESLDPFELDGSGSSDPDGTIQSYLWEMIEGPSEVTIGSSTSAIATVSGFTDGEYLFKLTVTDNDGGSSSSTTTVVVIKVLGLNDDLDGNLIKKIYPNPLMNGVVTFSLEFQKKTQASIHIFDMSGKKIETIEENQVFQQGTYEFSWQPNIKSNTYILSVEGDQTRGSRLFIVK